MGLKTIPILPSDNFDDTARFYKRLGFAEQGRWQSEYLILQRPSDELELHFWFTDSVDPRTNDVACFVRWDTATEARALHDEWASVDVAPGRLVPLNETDYGLLEFAIVDRHGNLIRIGGSLNAG